MTNCIKTGAWVHLDSYGASAPADLFTVGDCVVVRFPRAFDECCCYEDQPVATTHVVKQLEHGHDFWWRKDLGVLVIPSYMITETHHG